MVNLAIFISILLLYNAFFCIYLNSKFGKTLPISFIFIILQAWICEFTYNLSIFKYSIILTNLICVIAILIKVIVNKKKAKIYFKNYFNFSLIFFLFFSFYLYFVTRNRQLNNIDDYFHWGILIKDTIKNNQMYNLFSGSVSGVSLVPPFANLLAVAYSNFFNIYQESYSIYIFGLFTSSFFFFILDQLDLKATNILNSLVIFSIMVCLLLSVQVNPSMAYKSLIFNSLYIDWILSAHLVYAFYHLVYFKEDFTDFIFITFISSSVLMFKHVGIPLALLISGALFLKLFFTKKIFNLKVSLFFISHLLITAGFYLWWKLKLHFTYYPFIFSLSIQNKIVGIGHFSNNMYVNSQIFIFDFLKKFIKSIFTKTILIKPFNISYAVCIILITVFLIFFGYKKKEIKNYSIIAISYFLGSIGYSAVIAYSYITVFSEIESETLTMFGRYMQTYTYFGLCLCILLSISNKKILNNFFILLICLFFIEPKSLETLMISKKENNFRYSERTHLNYYFKNIYRGEKIIVVNQTDIKYKAMIKYISSDVKNNLTYLQANPDIEISDFKKLLDSNEYIFIGDYNDFFKKEFWDKISSENLYNSTLYRIEKSGENYVFKIVSVWEDKKALDE